MQIVVAYLAATVAFFAIDYVALTRVIKPTFEKQIGDWLLESPRMGPAAAFYLFYVVGLVYFVVNPALQGEWSWVRTFLTGAFLGAIAYGTYEFSNLATLTRWDWKLVVMDTTWGAVLTGTVALIGTWAGRLAA